MAASCWLYGSNLEQVMYVYLSQLLQTRLLGTLSSYGGVQIETGRLISRVVLHSGAAQDDQALRLMRQGSECCYTVS
jgi:hypothetical protein